MKYATRPLGDPHVWNQFLSSFPTLESGVPQVTFTQSFQWLTFQKSLGRKVFSLAFYDADTLVGVAAVFFVKARRGSYLYVRNGPVIDWSNKELAHFVVNTLKQIAKEQNAWFIRISPLIETGSLAETTYKSLGLVNCPMHDVEALDTWIMNIEESEEVLLQAAKKKTRYEVKKSINPEPHGAGLEAEISNDVSRVSEFYAILQDTVSRQKWNAYSLEFIQKEFGAFNSDNAASLIFVSKDDVTIAAGIFIHFANQTFYHYGASLSSYNKIPGPYRVIWEAIKEAKKRGHGYLNFWGIAPVEKPNHPWNGLTHFKMKFPGFAQRWSHSKDIPVTPLYWLTYVFEHIDKKRKGY